MRRLIVEWLNYHHLLYFWTVAHTGSVTAAAAELRLAQPTISGQLRCLEEALGEKLFRRVGRQLVLTDYGQVVYQYAGEIFSLGRELLATTKGKSSRQPARFSVGIAEVVPKLIAYRLLEPAMRLDAPFALICREDKPQRLVAELSVHALDLVLSDGPMPPTVSVRGYSHLLGECGVGFFATAALASKLRRGFPFSLDGAPLLLPTTNTSLRRSLDQWFYEQRIRPHIVSEFEDTALLKVFGEAGTGVFPAPSAIEKEIVRQYRVKSVGYTSKVKTSFYAISVERKIKHPAVLAISEAAQADLFVRPADS